MSLTREQLNSLQQEAEPIINSLDRKEAYLLAEKLEPEIVSLESVNPGLFNDAKKLLMQLKWVACPLIKDDREFFKLIREGFLEGFELDALFDTDILNTQVSEKLALQFGVGLSETVQGMLQALRENNQPIGNALIMVKNETKQVRPIVRHWLIDFLRNNEKENPSEMDESNYLFNNPNANMLSVQEKNILGKVLAFYDTYIIAARQLAQEDRDQLIVPPEGETTPSAQIAASALTEIAAAPAPVSIANKNFRSTVQENKEILNQPLTENPIKIADFEQPVRPTIKNWLADYIKQKGTGHHDELERSDYLFKSVNAVSLAPEERIKLSKILSAYDEDAEVPIASDTKLIDLYELMKQEAPKQMSTPPSATPVPPQSAQQPLAQTAVSQTTPTQPQPTAPVPPRTADPDTYREKVNEQDLAGPIKPITRPAPKLDGNIIDLKNINE